jgi:hypothetical protein
MHRVLPEVVAATNYGVSGFFFKLPRLCLAGWVTRDAGGANQFGRSSGRRGFLSREGRVPPRATPRASAGSSSRSAIHAPALGLRRCRPMPRTDEIVSHRVVPAPSCTSSVAAARIALDLVGDAVRGLAQAQRASFAHYPAAFCGSGLGRRRHDHRARLRFAAMSQRNRPPGPSSPDLRLDDVMSSSSSRGLELEVRNRHGVVKQRAVEAAVQHPSRRRTVLWPISSDRGPHAMPGNSWSSAKRVLNGKHHEARPGRRQSYRDPPREVALHATQFLVHPVPIWCRDCRAPVRALTLPAIRRLDAAPVTPSERFVCRSSNFVLAGLAG